MEWYVPFTILPGLGMLIMSSTSQIMNLSSEIGDLLSKKCNPLQHEIADMKITQLTRLTVATNLLYVSAACFVLSGILGAMSADVQKLPFYVLIVGVLLMLVSLAVLVVYSFRAISIRKLQHKHNHKL